MSLIGGYPAAARMIGQEVKNGNLPAKTGERMLCFCVNAGPSFLVGAVGIGMLGSLKAGMILYFSQAISSLLMGFLLSFQEKRRKIDGNVGVSTETYSKVFVESVVDSVQAIISMCAFVLLFCAVLAFCESSGLFVAAVEFLAKVFSVSEEKIQAFFTGMIEVTAGSRAVARYGSLPMLAFITSFGSLSVIFQIYGQLVGSGMKLSGFTLSRVVHGVVAAVICRGMIRIFPEAAETMAQGAEAAITSTSAVGSAAVLIVTAMFLLTVGRGQQ
ncbi:MAG: hypothetical protein E7487_01195 [Ruminococcaceae bacterium]|nr:hypothetical protein [Oscillospiraceae bacterium]